MFNYNNTYITKNNSDSKYNAIQIKIVHKLEINFT